MWGCAFSRACLRRVSLLFSSGMDYLVNRDTAQRYLSNADSWKNRQTCSTAISELATRRNTPKCEGKACLDPTDAVSWPHPINHRLGLSSQQTKGQGVRRTGFNTLVNTLVLILGLIHWQPIILLSDVEQGNAFSVPQWPLLWNGSLLLSSLSGSSETSIEGMGVLESSPPWLILMIPLPG